MCHPHTHVHKMAPLPELLAICAPFLIFVIKLEYLGSLESELERGEL